MIKIVDGLRPERPVHWPVLYRLLPALSRCCVAGMHHIVKQNMKWQFYPKVSQFISHRGLCMSLFPEFLFHLIAIELSFVVRQPDGSDSIADKVSDGAGF